MLYISTIAIEIICVLLIVFVHARVRFEGRWTESVATLFCQGSSRKIEDRDPLSSQASLRRVFGGWLGADFSAHEDDVGDAEADCHQAEQCCDVRPDQVEALAQLQRSR
jgi:hypothetical protein